MQDNDYRVTVRPEHKNYSTAQKRLARLGVNDDIVSDEVAMLRSDIKYLKRQNKFLTKNCKMMAFVINQLVVEQRKSGGFIEIPDKSIMTHIEDDGFRPPIKHHSFDSDKSFEAFKCSDAMNDLPF